MRVIRFPFDAGDGIEHAFGMAMRGVDHDHVAFGFKQGHSAAQTVFANGQFIIREIQTIVHPESIEHPTSATRIVKPFDKPFGMSEAIARSGAAA